MKRTIIGGALIIGVWLCLLSIATPGWANFDADNWAAILPHLRIDAAWFVKISGLFSIGFAIALMIFCVFIWWPEYDYDREVDYFQWLEFCDWERNLHRLTGGSGYYTLDMTPQECQKEYGRITELVPDWYEMQGNYIAENRRMTHRDIPATRPHWHRQSQEARRNLEAAGYTVTQ